jgi:repressor LexA
MGHSQPTKRQLAIFEFIRNQIESRGYGPTVREIGDRFGIGSPNGVVGHLRALEAKGLIERQANKSRSIQLSRAYRRGSRGLPLAGVVSAGALLEAVGQQRRIEFDKLFARQGAFVLEVRGDSMIDAQINDGDYIVVQPRRTPSSGDIVVAQSSDGEATVKYWFPEAHRIRLQPANPRLKPVYVRDVKVLGVVVGVVRNLQ